MAENLHQTPATWEQNDEYRRNPASTHGKPYSLKQQAGIAANKGRMWLYHEKLAARIFEPDELADGIPEGWAEAPIVPRATKDEPESDPAPSDELNALRAELDKLGVTYHYRAGVSKLRELLLKHSDG